MIKFTLEIYKPHPDPDIRARGGVATHHTEVFDLASERDAAMVLVAAREAAEPGHMVAMTYSRRGTRSNVRVRES